MKNTITTTVGYILGTRIYIKRKSIKIQSTSERTMIRISYIFNARIVDVHKANMG